MENNIILDLATTLSIITGIVLVDEFINIKEAMEDLLEIKLTDTGIIIERPRVANYIIENYPELEGLQVDTKAIDTWLEIQKQTFGNEFTFLPINSRKRKAR